MATRTSRRLSVRLRRGRRTRRSVAIVAMPMFELIRHRCSSRNVGHRSLIVRALGPTGVAVMVALLVGACGGSSSSPHATLTRYLADWSRGDWAGMRAQVLNPPADFT